MKSGKDAAIGAVISALVIFVINVSIGIFTIPSGTVIINETIYGDNNVKYSTVDIVNYEEKIFTDIFIDVPGKINEVITNDNLEIELKTDGMSKGSSIKILRFPEKLHSKIIIKFTSENNDQVSISNLKSNNLKLSTYKDYSNPIKDILFSSFIMAIVYALLLGIGYYIDGKQKNRLKEDLERRIKEITEDKEDLIKRFDRQSDESKELRRETDDIRRVMTKTKLLYATRISDLKRENDFWKDTMRKLVVDKKEVEDFLVEVSKNLKTYTTMKKDIDGDVLYFEVISAIEKYEETK